MKSILVLALLTPVFCMAQVTSQAIPADWTTHKSKNYSISYPTDWRLDTSKTMGIDAFFFSPADSAKDKFRENVNILTSSFDGQDISLDSFFHVSEQQIKMAATDCVILESKLYPTGKSSFYKIDFTSRQGIFQLRFIQYYFVKNGSGYTVTLTTMEDSYSNFEATGMRVLNSFALTD
jgi:hypothetical protein